MSTPGELVTAFCAEWRTGTVDSIGEYFSDDAVYHNIPLEPLVGKAAIVEFLRGFIGESGNFVFTVHHQAEAGNIVLNERTDTLTFGGRTVELPVMGTFEVRDGRIVAWRDYFDMGQLTGGPSGG